MEKTQCLPQLYWSNPILGQISSLGHSYLGYNQSKSVFAKYKKMYVVYFDEHSGAAQHLNAGGNQSKTLQSTQFSLKLNEFCWNFIEIKGKRKKLVLC